jgi:uncharacterized protein (TIGR03083 family)
MLLRDLQPVDARPLLVDERRDFLALLIGLSDEEWLVPTECGRWRVKDVALHVLDDDLGWLSRERDNDVSGLLTMDGDYRDFVRSLDSKNARWVVGASGLSRRVVIDLLAWSGRQVEDFYAESDLSDDSNVIWASSGAVPRWFDLSRDFTERWVHQQHIRDAVSRPGDHGRFLPAVLRTLVWAFPHQFTAPAHTGTTVRVDLDAGGVWTLTRRSEGWDLDEGSPNAPAAAVDLSDSAGWRLLTGLPVAAPELAASGRRDLIEAALMVRGIIV